jgi:cell division protein DivIC
MKKGFLSFWFMIPAWLRNPFVITISIFAVWMLFFDENNLSVQWKRKCEVAELSAKIDFYEKGIKETRHELKELTTNPETQEKFAREHYYMKHDNEDVFVFRKFETKQEKPKYWWQKIFS